MPDEPSEEERQRLSELKKEKAEWEKLLKNWPTRKTPPAADADSEPHAPDQGIPPS